MKIQLPAAEINIDGRTIRSASAQGLQAMRINWDMGQS